MSINNWLEKQKKTNKQWDSIVDFFKAKGYLRYDPSYFETYDAKKEINKSSIKLIDESNNIQLLRQDFSYNIINHISDMWCNEKLKLQYDGTVFRKTSHGFVEEKQIGVEFIGSRALSSDIEVLEMIVELSSVVKGIVVISHSGYLKGLLSKSLLSDEDKEILLNVIKLKKKDELKALDLELDLYKKCELLMSLKSENLQDLIDLESNPNRLKDLNVLKELKMHFNEKIEIDLSLSTKYQYYKGMICQVFIKNCNKSIMTGGRYDTEINKKIIPAVGFSIDFENYMKGGAK